MEEEEEKGGEWRKRRSKGVGEGERVEEEKEGKGEGRRRFVSVLNALRYIITPPQAAVGVSQASEYCDIHNLIWGL